jgi:signal transduction histidine kinase
VIRFIGYQAKEQNVTIKEAFSPSIPEISLNHKQMKQIFLNIILNALQSMPDGGVLKIKTALARNKKDNIEVTFADSGVGINQEIQGHIFEPFFTTRKGGTGLGLSFVDKVVRDHGGEITIKSSKGKGTKITLYFPLQSQVPGSPEIRKPKIIKT